MLLFGYMNHMERIQHPNRQCTTIASLRKWWLESFIDHRTLFSLPLPLPLSLSYSESLVWTNFFSVHVDGEKNKLNETTHTEKSANFNIGSVYIKCREIIFNMFFFSHSLPLYHSMTFLWLFSALVVLYQ